MQKTGHLNYAKVAGNNGLIDEAQASAHRAALKPKDQITYDFNLGVSRYKGIANNALNEANIIGFQNIKSQALANSTRSDIDPTEIAIAEKAAEEIEEIENKYRIGLSKSSIDILDRNLHFNSLRAAFERGDINAGEYYTQVQQYVNKMGEVLRPLREKEAQTYATLIQGADRQKALNAYEHLVQNYGGITTSNGTRVLDKVIDQIAAEANNGAVDGYTVGRIFEELHRDPKLYAKDFDVYRSLTKTETGQPFTIPSNVRVMVRKKYLIT